MRCSVLTAVHDPEVEHLVACLESVRRQKFRHLEHVVVDDGSQRPDVIACLRSAADRDSRIRLITRNENGGIVAASRDALAAATGETIVLLDHDDVLESDAIQTMVGALDAGADVAYSDHDLILPDGRFVAPYHKPDFSPEQLRSQNYILHLVAARRSAIDAVGGFREGFDGAQDHDLLLRLMESGARFAHVSEILYHWRQSPTSVASDPENKPWAFDAGLRAVRDHCERSGIDAEVTAGLAPGSYRIDRRLGARPRISVVIPTRGSARRVWGVRRCFVVEAVRSFVEDATYDDIEYVVVHDDVTPAAVLHALRRQAGDALTLVEYREPFNFSRKINQGVAASTGDVVLILNDDTELIEPTSLETMAAHLEVDDVGMVGPKLLFADGTIQDAGHVYNGHLLPALSGWRGDAVGPWQLRPLAVEREVSGVTAAACMVRRDVFDEVGGFDETMAVNFNDVDFSLKIRATGRRVIWTPFASWHHFESQTRPPTATPEEFAAVDARWHHEINHDPYYNHHLAPFRSDWLERPWASGDPLIEPEVTTGRWTRQQLLGAAFDDDRPWWSLARLAALAVALYALVWVQGHAQPETPSFAAKLVVAWLPLLVVVSIVSIAVARRRWVLASGVLVAIAPAVLAQFGAAQRHGGVAVGAIVVGVLVGPIARRSAATASYAAGVAMLGGLMVWWSSTAERAGEPDPTLGDAVGQIGTFTQRAIGGLGAFGSPAPQSASLAWWLAVGAVAGVVVAARVGRALLAPIAGFAVLLAACVLLERFRGPVDPAAGVWLLSGTIAFASARVEVPPQTGRRLLAIVLGLLAWAWAGSVAAQVRFVAVDVTQPAGWSRWLDWASVTSTTTASTLLPVTAIAGAVVAMTGWRLAPRANGPRGVNIVGYHSITAGLGERTRLITDALRAVGVRVAAYDLPVDSERETARLDPPAERFDTTVVVTPAFEVGKAAAAFPELFSGRRLVAGYWFWELDSVPASHAAGIDLVDEIWAPTRFVRDAYRTATLRPVRHVPLPIPEPTVAPLGRSELGIPADACVFLVSFSHLSVMERKNPIEAIAAFTTAFPRHEPGAERYRLIVKTLNGDRKPSDAHRLWQAAAVDDRIEIRDGRVEHAELMALVAASDVFVSLHRSEGLGLQIADAMWLGTPVIATDYSGSRDLLEHGLAELIPWHPTPVTNGDGAYPDSAFWAQPDLRAAAMSMRRLASDPERRERLATAARRRMLAQPDAAKAGRSLARLARCPRA